jgi:zinc protease
MLFGNYILGSGPASRLFGRIRGKEGLSYGVGSSFGASPRSDGASFTVNAIAAPQNVAKVEASFRDELANILREGYTKEEFDAAKISWAQGRQVTRAQDPALVGTLGLWTHVGRTMAFDADLEAKVAALTVDQVREAMNRHLDVNKMTFMKGGDFESVSGSSTQ